MNKYYTNKIVTVYSTRSCDLDRAIDRLAQEDGMRYNVIDVKFIPSTISGLQQLLAIVEPIKETAHQQGITKLELEIEMYENMIENIDPRCNQHIIDEFSENIEKLKKRINDYGKTDGCGH